METSELVHLLHLFILDQCCLPTTQIASFLPLLRCIARDKILSFLLMEVTWNSFLQYYRTSCFFRSNLLLSIHSMPAEHRFGILPSACDGDVACQLRLDVPPFL
jgi:hypothetical protein